MNHAAGIEAKDEPSEYGNIFIPASRGVDPFAALEISIEQERKRER